MINVFSSIEARMHITEKALWHLQVATVMDRSICKENTGTHRTMHIIHLRRQQKQKCHQAQDAKCKFPYLVTGADVYSIFQEVKDFVNVPCSGSSQETGVTVRLERRRQKETNIRNRNTSMFQFSVSLSFWSTFWISVRGGICIKVTVRVSSEHI